MSKLFYLSGIARSGSTLLGSMLNQNPEVHVTATSPLLDYLCINEQTLYGLNQRYDFQCDKAVRNVSRSIHDNFHSHVDKPFIIDKHRGWARNIDIIRDITKEEPKVICTYRPIIENICSFIKLADNDPDNFIDKDLKELNKPINNVNRAMRIWEAYSSDPFNAMLHALKNNKQSVLIIQYKDIVNIPSYVMNEIYSFLEIPAFREHTFTNIKNTCAESDKAWGVKGLHDIRPELKSSSYDPKEVFKDNPQILRYFEVIDKQLTDLF